MYIYMRITVYMYNYIDMYVYTYVCVYVATSSHTNAFIRHLKKSR